MTPARGCQRAVQRREARPHPRYERGSEEALCDAKPWVERSYLDYVEGKGGASILHILGEDPEAFLGLDAGKINRAMQAARSAQKRWREMTMKDEVAWSIVAVPTENWAKKVFPALGAEQAVERSGRRSSMSAG